MKWWRRNNPTQDKRPKGFVIEVIAADCMDLEEAYYGELFVRTMESIVEKYQTYVLLQIVPSIPDPAVPGNSVTEGMSVGAFVSFYNKVKAHAELGRQALEETDPEKATELWLKIFGDRFPKTETKKSESTLANAVRASSLTFPDKPITPKKPGGFA
jgi:hypothetical protein